MPKANKKQHPKIEALKEDGVLNANPHAIKDPKFQEGEFFDPHDLVQVKYEMLRRVDIENISITDATKEYGFCRPTYYQAKSSFEKGGVGGLLPKKRGPQGPHKLRKNVLEFLEKNYTPGQPIRANELAELVRHRFNLDVHPRTIERALCEKKARN